MAAPVLHVVEVEAWGGDGLSAVQDNQALGQLAEIEALMVGEDDSVLLSNEEGSDGGSGRAGGVVPTGGLAAAGGEEGEEEDSMELGSPLQRLRLRARGDSVVMVGLGRAATAEPVADSAIATALVRAAAAAARSRSSPQAVPRLTGMALIVGAAAASSVRAGGAVVGPAVGWWDRPGRRAGRCSC